MNRGRMVSDDDYSHKNRELARIADFLLQHTYTSSRYTVCFASPHALLSSGLGRTFSGMTLIALWYLLLILLASIAVWVIGTATGAVRSDGKAMLVDLPTLQPAPGPQQTAVVDSLLHLLAQRLPKSDLPSPLWGLGSSILDDTVQPAWRDDRSRFLAVATIQGAPYSGLPVTRHLDVPKLLYLEVAASNRLARFLCSWRPIA